MLFYGKIEIKAISSSSDLNKFIKIPFYVYKDDPYWIPPLIFERKSILAKKILF